MSEKPMNFNANSHGNSGNDGSYEDFVDVILIFLPKYEKEFIQNIRVIRNADGDVDLYDLMQTLKGMAFPIDRNVISYYSYTNDMYIYCGNDPVATDLTIPGSEVANTDDTKQVTLRIRQVINNPAAYIEPNADSDVKLEGAINFGDGPNASKQKRTKERKIGEILEKVLQWRKLYTGVNDPTTGQMVKLSLEDAAQRVNISKKSLDDYLLQIRFGKKHGFNFNDHYNERVGVLRTFVKKHKGKKGDKDDLDDDDEEDDHPKPKNTKVETTTKKSKKV